MSFDIKRQRIVARRMMVFGGVKVVLFATFIGRIASLQLFQNKSYRKLSENNRTRKTIITPKRGIIMDKNGVEIAGNKKYYRLSFVPSKFSSDVRQINRLAQILGVSENVRNQMLKRYKIARGVSFVIYKYLTHKELAKVAVNLTFLQSIAIEEAFVRVYKDPFVYSSILGYISESGVNESNLIKSSDIKVGKSGLEKYYNSILLGRCGQSITEVDSRGNKIGKPVIENAVDGATLNLSLDHKLQEFAYQHVKDKVASVAVIHIPTNSVIACLSTPSFNANSLSKQITSEEWSLLNNDPDKPLMNRVFSALYPPGSIFKIITALAYLQQGGDAKQYEYCPGYFYYGNHKFNCWKKEGHGKVSMSEAIKCSCNVYFYKKVKDMDIKEACELAKSLGLGSEPYSEILKALNYENGLVPSPKWKRRHQGELWQGGDSINFGIGQGFNLVNCFQLAVMVSRVASGKVLTPTFINEDSDEKFLQNQNLNKLAIKQEYLDIVKHGMFRATNEAGGTSFYSRLGIDDFEMCGKTGTAQTVSRFIEKNEKREEFENTHGLFVGFAPYKDPQYAIAVINEHGGFGSSSAAPIAKQIIKFIYDTYHKTAVQ